MKHPHSSKVLEVIKAFESVLPMAIRENHLNMSTANVNCGTYACGTVHCHAGWYAIAKGLHLNEGISYSDGVIKMCKDLGITDGGDFWDSPIEAWASKNKDIWGNRGGNVMFSNRIAFKHPTKRPKGAENLQHIIDHWREVYERLLDMEQKEVKPVEETKPEPPFFIIKEVHHYVSISESIKEDIKEPALN